MLVRVVVGKFRLRALLHKTVPQWHGLAELGWSAVAACLFAESKVTKCPEQPPTEGPPRILDLSRCYDYTADEITPSGKYVTEWDLKDRTRLAKTVAPLARSCAIVVSRLEWQDWSTKEPQQPGFYVLQDEDFVQDNGAGLHAVRDGTYRRRQGLVKGALLVQWKTVSELTSKPRCYGMM